MSSEPIHVLFVCLGNICRSPLAEGLFRHLLAGEGLEEEFRVDSAGTGGWHAGEPPDARATETARRRGVELSGSARRLEAEDLRRFDYVIAMDAENLAGIEQLASGLSPRAEIHLLREFDPEAGDELDVPDPYFGGAEGFERVHDVVERSVRGLLEHIRSERVR